MSEQKQIPGFKGFKKDMTCQGFHFASGQTYTHGGEVKICKSGFHFVENPLDALTYYAPFNSVFCAVTGSGKTERNEKGDSKIVAEKITIGAKVEIAEMVKAAVKFVFCRVKSTTGDSAHSATTGDSAHSATSGECAHSATTGDSTHSATTGDSAHSATAGDYAHSATTGHYAHSATTGSYAHSATAGNYAHSATTGNYAHSATAGNYAISCALGMQGSAKAAQGSWLVLAEYTEEGKKVKLVRTVKVDGKKIKADTFYTLKDGKFQAVNK